MAPRSIPEGRLEIRYKPEETPITLAAKKSYWGRVFLDWAQYPITETETLESPQEGYIVRLRDLRYMQMPGLFEPHEGTAVEQAAIGPEVLWALPCNSTRTSTWSATYSARERTRCGAGTGLGFEHSSHRRETPALQTTSSRVQVSHVLDHPICP